MNNYIPETQAFDKLRLELIYCRYKIIHLRFNKLTKKNLHQRYVKVFIIVYK